MLALFDVEATLSLRGDWKRERTPFSTRSQGWDRLFSFYMEIGEAWKRVYFGPPPWRPCCWCRWAPGFTRQFHRRDGRPRLAQQIDQAAERYRHDLAIEWLGQAMPNWAQPCLMTVQVGPHLGAGGATTFVFDRGEVFGWRMTIQGSAERILDSVLPHEVTHMVFATHFRRPLPRWADEGGATSMECPSEKAKQRDMLLQVLRTGRGIAFNQMFAMTDYPPRRHAAVCARIFAGRVSHRARRPAQVRAVPRRRAGEQPVVGGRARHYGVADLGVLQNNWLTWVRNGFPVPRRARATGNNVRRGGKRAQG